MYQFHNLDIHNTTNNMNIDRLTISITTTIGITIIIIIINIIIVRQYYYQ